MMKNKNIEYRKSSRLTETPTNTSYILNLLARMIDAKILFCNRCNNNTAAYICIRLISERLV